MKKILSFLAMTAAILAVTASCHKGGDEPDPGTEEGEYVAPITIDGDFADWAKLDASKIATAKCDPDAVKTALKVVKVYADELFIFVYFEWDTDQTSFIPGDDHVPFHMYINGDGNSATGGYGDEFSDACSDLLLEGGLYDENGLSSYDPGGFKWIGEPNGTGWGWEKDGENILPAGSGLCCGAGVEGKYEIRLTRELYPLGKIADTFSIGFDIQKDWETVGMLPNSHFSDDNASGTAPSLQVTTVK